MRVVVLDMQPITPPTGGGRLRLLGVYHALGSTVRCHYVGTYDWRGESYRCEQVSPCLTEEVVPLSVEHHGAADAMAGRANGKNVIDVAFHTLGHLSPDFVRHCEQAIADADIVVFSHPWVYPLVRHALRPGTPIVYDAHNVEAFLRFTLFDERHEVERDVLREVIRVEREICQDATRILSCADEDSRLFCRLFGVPADRVRVVPNGVMAEQLVPASCDERLRIKRELGLPMDRTAAIFLGSDYGPNVEAAEFIASDLARRLPDFHFIVAGGVGAKITATSPNVVVTGRLDEAQKINYLRASDIALNPMFSGSGTNIKMFDYMAAGLCVVSTHTGARGIDLGADDGIFVVPATGAAFVACLREACGDGEALERRRMAARAAVLDQFAWERISPVVGEVLRGAIIEVSARPRASVIIPSYRRPAELTKLLEALDAQSWREFEVIIVDQSEVEWPDRHRPFGIPVRYFRTPVRGAVNARNAGAAMAAAPILGFVDDDCLPEPDWVEKAVARFSAGGVVGLEGRIDSDHFGDPAYRPVTNVGFEGVGFMTANLWVRRSAFFELEGFDRQFDRPHFREDTDFGWRLQELGSVPYADDVRVFHPAQRRSIERESLAARDRFFEKDALLYAKHPARYVDLFRKEGHWMRAGFWEHFVRGGMKYQIDLSAFEKLRAHLSRPTSAGAAAS